MSANTPPNLNQVYEKFADVGTLKHAFYDWYGLNEWLFLKINSFHNELYDHIMLLLSMIGDHEYFKYYYALAVISAVLMVSIRKIQNRAGMKAYVSKWLGVLIIMPLAFGAVGITTKTLKSEFGYKRPYAALSQDVVVLEKREKGEDTRSFPSGHASFSMFLLIAFWPVLSESLRTTGTLLVLGVGWSRMALGVHFPADVLAGFLLAAMLTLLVRWVVQTVFRTLFKLHC